MPLKYIKTKVSKKVTLDNALHLAISATAIAQELANMSQFPPVSALVNIIMLIFQTVQDVQTNKEGCHRLARRARSLLLDINDQMTGRWETAPELLLKNLKKLEGSLQTIYDFMKSEVDCKWSNRFLRKYSVEAALQEYNTLLDDASQSFQIATLINIHYAVAQGPSKHITATGRGDVPPAYITDGALPPAIEMPKTSSLSAVQDIVPVLASLSTSTIITMPNPQINKAVAKEVLDDYYLPGELVLTPQDDHGFRRYHQSDVMLRGRSCLKEGWWEGAMEVQAGGQNALIKRYEGVSDKAAKEWLRDVKMLSNVYHPNLPQMVGFSADGMSTPFILLSNVQTRSPHALVLETARSSNLATCANLMLRFYRDLSDTALYIQRQFNLSDAKVQDFIEKTAFRWEYIYGTKLQSHPYLAQGMHVGKLRPQRMAVHGANIPPLEMLPNRGYMCDKTDKTITPEMQQKINHLVTLAKGLLPSEKDPPILPSYLQELIEDDGEASPPLTLRQVRNLTFDANAHSHSWSERTVPAGKFALGDLGYIPAGKDMDAFVLVRNVIKDNLTQFSIESTPRGDHWCWEQIPLNRQPIDTYALPSNVLGWAVAVPPKTQIDVAIHHEISIVPVVDAWRYLLDNGEALAKEANIRPEDLILVTKTGTNQDFYIREMGVHSFGAHMMARQPPQFGFGQPQPFGQPRLGMSGFNQHMHPAHQFCHRPALPSIFYLFTSMDMEHEPYWSQTPICVPKGAAIPPLPRDFTYRIGWKHGFLNYVQLHAEDFTD